MLTIPDLGKTKRFEIRKRLGAGGMGIVYEAFDRERGTEVALKTLARLDPLSLYRFKKEFRAVADVGHENLVELYELISEGDQWFFTMELVRGVDWLSWVWGRSAPSPFAKTETAPSGSISGVSGLEASQRDAPASLDRARLRDGFRQLVNGLLAVHDAGLLHRDVKPSNVLVAESGRVVLCDFGIVTEQGRHELGETDVMIGTPAYMAPEQALAGPVGPAADWYSAGVVLFEAITGRLPFLGAPMEIVDGKLRYEAPRASSLADVPVDLDEVCALLLEREPTRRIDGREALRRLGVESRPSRVSVIAGNGGNTGDSSFVGRETQLGALEDAFARVRDGGDQVVFVRGRSGMGKSTLVRRFLESLGDRAMVLSGRCYERESVPYKAFDSAVDAISRALMERSPEQLKSLLPDDAAVLPRLFPVLQRVDAIARARREHESPDPLQLRARAFAAMRGLFVGLSRERPVALFIDDFQWGDGDSAVLLSELLAPPDAPPLLVIIGHRAEDEGSQLLTEVRTRLSSTRTIVDIEVSALSDVEARKLAATLLDRHDGHDGQHDGTLDAVVREGEGSPLFVAELARRARSPDGRADEGVRLDDLLRERVSALPTAARRLLEVIALAGRPLRLDVTLRAADLPPGDRMAALGTLRIAHLVRTAGLRSSDAIEAYHDRIRESLLSLVDSTRSKELHASLASSLLAHGETDPEALYVHFRGAGDLEAAAVQALAAAKKSAAALAFDRAAEFYRLSIQLEVDESRIRPMRVALADALVLAGRGALAAESYLAALEGATESERLELLRRAAEQLLCSGRIDEGTKLLDQVLAAVGLRLAPNPQRALLTLLFLRLWIFVRGYRFRARDASQVPAREITRIDTCASVAAGLGLVDMIQGAAFQSRALLLALRAGEVQRIARALAYEAGFQGGEGSPNYARAKAVNARARALTSGGERRPETEGIVNGSDGMVEYFSGNWRAAEERFETAIGLYTLSTTSSARWELDTAEYYLICSLVYQGRMAEVARRLPVCRRNAEDRGDLYFACNLCVGETNLAWLAADDPVGARAVVSDMMGGWSKRGFHAQHWFELQALCLIDLYEGNPRLALERIDATWPALSRSMILRVQVGRAMALFLRGSAAAAVGEKARAARDVRSLRSMKHHWTDGLANLVASGIEPREVAIATLGRAVEQLEAVHMASFAAAARRRLGEWTEPDPRAAEYFAREHIASPERWTRMLVPQGTSPQM